VEHSAHYFAQSSHASCRGGLGALARLLASAAADFAGGGNRMPSAAPMSRLATVESRSGLTGANRSRSAEVVQDMSSVQLKQFVTCA
jgi:hypothetical protein